MSAKADSVADATASLFFLLPLFQSDSAAELQFGEAAGYSSLSSGASDFRWAGIGPPLIFIGFT